MRSNGSRSRHRFRRSCSCSPAPAPGSGGGAKRHNAHDRHQDRKHRHQRRHHPHPSAHPLPDPLQRHNLSRERRHLPADLGRPLRDQRGDPVPEGLLQRPYPVDELEVLPAQLFLLLALRRELLADERQDRRLALLSRTHPRIHPRIHLRIRGWIRCRFPCGNPGPAARIRPRARPRIRGRDERAGADPDPPGEGAELLDLPPPDPAVFQPLADGALVASKMPRGLRQRDPERLRIRIRARIRIRVRSRRGHRFGTGVSHECLLQPARRECGRGGRNLPPSRPGSAGRDSRPRGA